MNHLLPLLKREMNEHRGGLLLTPFIVGGVLVLFLILGLITSLTLKIQTSFGGEIARYALQSNPELLVITAKKALQAFGLAAAAIINLTCAIVVFFYCLGTLYDDRRDRSILFWRSLPVSDALTVWSKVLIAAVVAPSIAFVAVIATQVLMWIAGSVVVLSMGGSLKAMFTGDLAGLTSVARHLVALPLHALWVLPLVGWLLLASAFAKSKPFLWAVLPPLGVAIADSWFDVTSTLSLPKNTVFKLIGERIFNDPLPMAANLSQEGVRLAGSLIPFAAAPSSVFSDWPVYLQMSSLWIGALLGVAMIVASVYLRRKSEDAY